MEASPMTAEALDALREEINRLETDERASIAEQIKAARAHGDLKENAEYHAAKEAQAHLETKIKRLRTRELNAEVVEAATGGVIGFGSRVEVTGEDGSQPATYRLVSAQEASPRDGLLSFDSPVAAALNGKRAGDTAAVDTPNGERRLRIVSVS